MLATICYGAFYFGLGSYPLWDPDEGRSGVIAKEMIQSGNWLTLTHHGAPYYDKPALYFWLVALGSALFGLGETAVRLPSAVAATLTVGLLYIWGYNSGGRDKGLWAGAVLATSLEFVALGRFGKMDMAFTFFFTAGLLFFLHWKKRAENAPIWPFYLSLAFASLTKGPIGILLPLLIVGISIALEKRWDLMWKMNVPGGFAIIALVSGSWYLPAALRDPEYIKNFLWNHNVLRFFTLDKGIDHAEPFFYFIPVFFGGFLPWSLLLPPVLASLWLKSDAASRTERLFLAVWAFTVLIFFSLSRNKLGTYILPMFPPLALWTAGILCDWINHPSRRTWSSHWLFYGSLVWLLLLFFGLPISRLFLKPDYFPFASGFAPLALASVFLALGGVIWYLRAERWAPWTVCASFLSLTVWFYGDLVHELSKIRSSRALARIVDRTAPADSRVVFIRSESFPFYMSNPVEEVPTPKVVSHLLQQPVHTVALVKEKHIKELERLTPGTLFVWEVVPSGLALVANFPSSTAHDLSKPLNR